MGVNLTEKLKEFGKEMKEWDKKRTSVTGVSIVKLPSKGDDIALGLELLPVNKEGSPVKRKALFITSLEQWEAFQEVFTNPKAFDLIKNINDLRKEKTVVAAEESEEVFEL